MATFITISQIVESTLINEGDNGLHKYAQRLEWALRGVKKISLDVLPSKKSEEITINDNNTIDLPTDCINYTKVGTLKGNILTPLIRTDNGTFPLDCVKTLAYNPTKKDAVNDSLLLSANYGYRINQGYYKDWSSNNQIILYNVEGVDSVYLEYISNGMQATGETLIDSRAEDFLITWVEYLDRKYKKDNMFKQYEADAYNELRQLNERLGSFSRYELIDSLRSQFRLKTPVHFNKLVKKDGSLVNTPISEDVSYLLTNDEEFRILN